MAPRKPVQYFGRQALNRAKELFEGESVRVAQDPTQDTGDRYGRLLAYVYLWNGTNYNLEMIRDGFAHEYTYETPYRYQAEFKVAARRARREGAACGARTPVEVAP